MEKDYLTVKSKLIRARFKELFGRELKPIEIYKILREYNCSTYGRTTSGDVLFVYGSDDDYEITVDKIIYKIYDEMKRYEIEQDFLDSIKDNSISNNNETPDNTSRETIMKNVSNDLLKKDEVFFNDSYDDELYEKICSKKIYITEKQLNFIKENKDSHYFVNPEKVKIVKNFLDKNFIRAKMPNIGNDGYPTTTYFVGLKGTDGNVCKNMSQEQLFYLIQDKYKNIYLDKDKRDKFLKQVIKDWYNKKITREGLLSVNKY